MVYKISLRNASILYLFSRELKHTFKFSFITVLHSPFYITSRIFFALINIIFRGKQEYYTKLDPFEERRKKYLSISTIL